MKRLIVNADDFGLCRGVNLGILHAYQSGILTSATLMVNMPGAGEAFHLARQNPGLGVGVHITLTAGRPLAAGVDSLTGPDGRFLRLPELAACAQREHLITEVGAQVQAFLAAGLQPTHLDSHHHVHRQIPAVAEAINQIAAELGLPVRQFGPRFLEGFYGKGSVATDRLLALLGSLSEGRSELMCHPGFVDADLLALSSYTRDRATEVASLTDSLVKAAIRSYGITLVNYRDEERVVAYG